jgi:hypothetical protein
LSTVDFGPSPIGIELILAKFWPFVDTSCPKTLVGVLLTIRFFVKLVILDFYILLLVQTSCYSLRNGLYVRNFQVASDSNLSLASLHTRHFLSAAANTSLLLVPYPVLHFSSHVLSRSDHYCFRPTLGQSV